MKRVRENEVKEILKSFNQQNLKIQIEGIFKQECFIENAEILFSDNDIEFKIKGNKNNMIFNLSYIEEIYFFEKNKLKFLTNMDLEILISFL